MCKDWVNITDTVLYAVANVFILWQNCCRSASTQHSKFGETAFSYFSGWNHLPNMYWQIILPLTVRLTKWANWKWRQCSPNELASQMTWLSSCNSIANVVLPLCLKHYSWQCSQVSWYEDIRQATENILLYTFVWLPLVAHQSLGFMLFYWQCHALLIRLLENLNSNNL